MADEEFRTCPVNSHNEWDPLEEVIVGRLEHAMLPDAQIINKHTFPPAESSVIQEILAMGGVPYPPEMIEAAQSDLDAFLELLDKHQIRIRRPDVVDYEVPFRTPAWRTPSGSSATNPRDPFSVIGDQILEAPMADRSRYFEAWAYRALFMEYFRGGARWTAAPKPQLIDEQYDQDFVPSQPGDDPMRYVVAELEPVFDAADFVRCGRDIVGQRSHVTNRLGIDWLARHLGEGYRVHEFPSKSPQAMHIDTTLMPLAPGKLLVNPDWVDQSRLPDCFEGWEILVGPRPVPPAQRELRLISSWANMNVLMLDERRVVVERRQEPMIALLRDWGFEPLPCPFENYYPFLGSFHCATLDIRRQGDLQSYRRFNN